MPRKSSPKTDIDEDDWVWILARVTRIAERDEDPPQITVLMPNGNKETITFNPDTIQKAEE